MSDAHSRPSDALVDLVCAAFDHAFASIRGGGPLVPFALTERGDDRGIARFVAERLEEAVEHGRTSLRTLEPAPERVALAFDGYLRGDGGRTDAIFIEAQDRGGQAFTFYQRYAPAKGLLRRRPKPLDECPVLGGDGPDLL